MNSLGEQKGSGEQISFITKTGINEFKNRISKSQRDQCLASLIKKKEQTNLCVKRKGEAKEI